MNTNEEETVLCKVCGGHTPHEGVKLCALCWQVASKLGNFSTAFKAKYVDELNKVLEEGDCSLRVKTDVPSKEEVAIAAKESIQEKYHQLQREFGQQCETNARRKREACAVMGITMDNTFDWWSEFLKFVELLKRPRTSCPLDKALREFYCKVDIDD
jgi:ribosomal protein L37E